MLGLVADIVVNAVAIWVATLLVPGVSIAGGSTSESLIALLVVGAALALVNAVVKPMVKFLTGCLYLLTLGLIALVVNAGMLALAGRLAGVVGVHLDTGPFFWSTVLAALVVTVVSVPLHHLLAAESED